MGWGPGAGGRLILAPVLFHLRPGQRAGHLVIVLVEGSAHGNPEGLTGVVSDIEASPLRGGFRPVPVPGAVLVFAGQGIGPLVGGAGDAGPLVVQAIASGDDADAEFRRAPALLGDDVDDAADGRIPVQDAVCASHDLDPLDVVQGDLQPVDGPHVRVVQPPAVQHDQGLPEGVVPPDAAHVDVRLGAVAAVIAELDAFQLFEHLHHRGRARLFDLPGGDNGYVCRNAADLLPVPGGRHDHLFQPDGGLRRVFRFNRGSQRQEHHGEEQGKDFGSNGLEAHGAFLLLPPRGWNDFIRPVRFLACGMNPALGAFPILQTKKSVARAGFRSAYSCGAAPASHRLPVSDGFSLLGVTRGRPLTGCRSTVTGVS